MAGNLKPSAKCDKASKRRQHISKSIEELAELFQTRKTMALDPSPSHAVRQHIAEIEGAISAYLKPRKAIEQALELQTDRRLRLAVSIVQALLEELQENRCKLGDFDHRILESMADNACATVDCFADALLDVMPGDWDGEGYPNGPRDAACTVVARLNNLSKRTVYSRIANVDDSEAWRAKRERGFALLARGGEAAERVNEECGGSSLARVCARARRSC